jgi:hypothetical protein
MLTHIKAKIGVGFGMALLTGNGLARICNFAAVFAHLGFRSMFTQGQFCLIQKIIG